MHIIDKKKKEFDDVPHTLEGEVLLNRTYDSKGNLMGWHTIKPEILKWYSENKTDAELETMGFKDHKDKIAMVKADPNIQAKEPDIRYTGTVISPGMKRG